MSTPGQRPWAPRSCCGPGSALTVAELSTRWAELGELSPILVIHSTSEAHWAQHADVLMADNGLVVARLFAPYAKQTEPAPGTVWPTAATFGATTYRPPSPESI